MSSLNPKQKNDFEELFGMQSGYVLDFSNRTFCNFIKESIGIDIYEDPPYRLNNFSKANKLRQIWEYEDNSTVSKLMLDLIAYFEEGCLKCGSEISPCNKMIIERSKVSMYQLGNSVEPIDFIADLSDDTSKLIATINEGLQSGKCTETLDRVHTLATKVLRNLCKKNGIPLNNDRNIPLNDLYGILSKQYKGDGIVPLKLTKECMSCCATLLKEFNDTRNNYSFAHDNPILDEYSARYVLSIIRETLVFIIHFDDEINRNLKT